MNGSLNIKLNSEIYDIQSVRQAMSAFQKIACVELSFADGYYVLEFTNGKYPLMEIKDEFCNYLVDAMNKRTK